MNVDNQKEMKEIPTIDLEWGWSASICSNENEPLLVPTSTENTAKGDSSVVIFEPFLSKVTLNGLGAAVNVNFFYRKYPYEKYI